MPTHRVKLASDAFDKSQGADVGVAFLESEESYKAQVDDDGWVLVRPREYHRLQVHGLVEEAELESLGEADNPDEEDLTPHERTLTKRQEPRSSGVHPGGVGHQPDDAYSNQQVQKEIKASEEHALSQRTTPLVPPGDEVRRSDHALPEQVKAQQKLERDRDKAQEKAQEQGRKDREKVAKERERDNAKAEKEQAARAKQESEQDDGKDQSRSQRNDKVKDALKADDKNDDSKKGGK